jgi:hypothetical protein
MTYSYGDPTQFSAPEPNPVVVEDHKDGNVSMQVADGLVNVVMTPQEADTLAAMLATAASRARARQI